MIDTQTDPTESYPDGPWAHYLGHLLWEVAALASILGEAELADTPLTMASLGILDTIGASPGTTVAEIARGTPKTQQAVSQVVGRVEKLGWVERRLGSGRGVGLYLTDAGQQMRVEGERREQRLEAELRGRLGDERFSQLRTLLEEARVRLSDARSRATLESDPD